MDLTLNFAPPAPAGGTPGVKARAGGAAKAKGGRWSDRMKQNQLGRRLEKKQQQQQHDGRGKAATHATNNAQPTSDTSNSDVAKMVRLARSAAADDARAVRAANSGQKQQQQQQQQQGQGKETNERTKGLKVTSVENARNDGPSGNVRASPSKQDLSASSAARVNVNGITQDAGGDSVATVPGKRQVISSLFSSLPKLPTRKEKSDTSQDEPGPSVLTPSNAPSLGDTFDELNLRPELVSHLTHKMSLSHPTIIQKLAVPALCKHESAKDDFFLQAQTGSGKTLSYLLPIVQDLLQLSEEYAAEGKQIDRSTGTLAVILVPTRELANQIFEVATKLLSFHDGPSHRWITPGLLTGGAHRQHEKARLRKGLPLLIATPGRLLDHLETTKAFRLAGENKRTAEQRLNGSKATRKEDDTDDEFAYEDQVLAGNSTAANDEGDGGISSDEDFEGLSTSRSHRGYKEAMAYQKSRITPEDSRLSLRWLVLDEADRLMDMGFEPQISSIMRLLQERLDKRIAIHNRYHKSPFSRMSKTHGTPVAEVASRRTILCSATIEENVEKLVGITLKDPLVIKVTTGDEDLQHPRSGTSNSSGKATKYAPPDQLGQFYTVVPPKLRFVGLIALLRQTLLSLTMKNKTQKILVFMSCTDAVDFYWTSLSGLSMGRGNDASSPKEAAAGEGKKLEASSILLPDAPVYRLHGSLDLQTRLASLKAFSEQKGQSVLFCTSVAARGIDVQGVTCVIQYDLPTEGGVNEYIHRVGRTARAGEQGQAWAFLLPSEVGWVDWAQSSMEKDIGDSKTPKKPSRLVDKQVDDLLKAGFGGGHDKEYETRATDVQMAFERWVSASEDNARLARKAFSSHVRAYATHPSNEKQFFHVKNLHLGHLAKAFGLREAPSGIGGGGGSKGKDAKQKDAPAKQTVGRKRKRNARAADSSAPESEDDDKRGKPSNRIPRSGRALEGKGLHGPKMSTSSEFNVAGAGSMSSILTKRKK